MLSLVAEELFIAAPSVVLLVTFDVMVVSDVYNKVLVSSGDLGISVVIESLVDISEVKDAASDVAILSAVGVSLIIFVAVLDVLVELSGSVYVLLSLTLSVTTLEDTSGGVVSILVEKTLVEEVSILLCVVSKEVTVLTCFVSMDD